MKIALIVALASLCLAAVVSRVSETTAAPAVSSARVSTTTTGAPIAPTVSTAAPAETITTIEVTGGHDLVVDDAQPTPIRVRVPALDLDLDLASVGVDEAGDFDVPRSGIGWYQFGPSPGEEGSAVLAAHVDYAGQPGAFFRLDELVAGDAIEIDSDDGITRRFVVVEQVLYDKTTLPADELFREGGDQALRLITCGGTFDHDARSYLGNRVVTAVPAGEYETTG